MAGAVFDRKTAPGVYDRKTIRDCEQLPPGICYKPEFRRIDGIPNCWKWKMSLLSECENGDPQFVIFCLLKGDIIATSRAVGRCAKGRMRPFRRKESLTVKVAPQSGEPTCL